MRKRVYSKPLIDVNRYGYRGDIKSLYPLLVYNSGFNTCYSTTRTVRQRTADRPKAEGGSGKALK